MPEIKPGVINSVMKSLLSPVSGLTPEGKVLNDGMRTVIELRQKYGGRTLDANQLDKYLDLSHYEHARK
jgi:hypothetical protein